MQLSVSIVPLVPNGVLPYAASPRTRESVPAGYGVQEQCLPFTAASALGILIPSPICFGLCEVEEVPAGCHYFRSPLEKEVSPNNHKVFYVADNPTCNFRLNAYEFEHIPEHRACLSSVREPGLSFFDRRDQHDLFKLHLPWIWRTPESVDTLFMPLLNRGGHGLEVLSGLVETDWYMSPVNLAIRKPAGSVHVKAGDPVAHAIAIPREFRKPVLQVLPVHARLTRETRKGLAEWDRLHAENRAAYKMLARSNQGRVETS